MLVLSSRNYGRDWTGRSAPEEAIELWEASRGAGEVI